MARPQRDHRPLAERFCAAMVCGPPGHLWSVMADLAVFGAARLRARVAGSAGP